MVGKPEPAEEAVTIFNELGRLPASARETIEKKDWRLAALERKVGSEPTIFLARAQAHSKLGDAQGMREALKNVWPLRHTLGADGFYNYAAMLRSAGLCSLVHEILNERDGRPEFEFDIRCEAALAQGDMEELGRLAESSAPGAQQVGRFIDGVETRDLKAHLASVAAMSRRCTAEAFTVLRSGLKEDDHAPFPVAHLQFFVPWAFEDRFAAEYDLVADLESYAAEHGVERGAILQTWVVTLLDVREY